ncbi:MAG: SpoIIE family protein phosphatase [Proteobacteria bacterium]|nr:SpoIIE family protein phosphatase [Pseudomonadota bacterium]MBU1583563.1 SpoIIE family protein phosphatase [Pseudomonadota bacterium]MBU2453430.1 SpoIIE family protein phosphatase [Pseudomonadota bacterium]MBU2629986.1 SpoIIE family protein phosphatase [Pseudomonadota bacterium]
MKKDSVDSFHIQDISLSLKILIPTIFFTALVIPVFTFYLIDSQRSQSEALLEAKAKNITYLLAYSNINTLWNFDIEELQNIADSFFKDQDIVSIVIKDQKGEIHADLQKKVLGSKQIIETSPIEKDGEIIGELQTVFTNFYIEKNLSQIKNKIIVLSLIIFFVITFFIVVVSKKALKPLKGVLEGIDHVAKGDYQYRIKRSSNDEIGQVAKQFNDMSKKIIGLQEATVKSAEAGREMEIAKNIQMSLQPSLEKFTTFGFEISANMTPAEDVGGDYYDLIESGDKKFWFGVGDVTGHGLVSGLVMMMAQVSINTLIRSVPGLTPEEVLIHANTIIQANIRDGLKKDHHMTINFIKEEREGLYRYAGAHEIILIYRAKEKEIEQIPTRGMWIGVIPDISKPINKYAGSFTLETNDILFLYTDGVIEIKNQFSEQYDIKRLSNFLKTHASLDTEAIKQCLLFELNEFKEKQMDDITFLIMRKE